MGDIYSAKKLFEVLEPKGVKLGRTTCCIYLLSQEIKENAKKLQISTYALRDAIAETLTTHFRSVEMHFPIRTSDGLKIGFTVLSDKLDPNEIYERLRKNAISLNATKPPELAKKVEKVWNLKHGPPRIPLNEIVVDGVDATQYSDPMTMTMATTNIETTTKQIEMIDMNEGKKQGLLQNDAMSAEYEQEMNALNAQIAMNQYLMMKQMQYVDENEENMPNLKQMMMEQMERMKSMIDMTVPYDANIFKEFNNEWNKQQQQQQQKQINDYEPPPPTTTKEEDDDENDDEQEREISFKM